MSVQTELYQTITNTIIKQLESGVTPWLKPWKAIEGSTSLSLPFNGHSGRNYNGINLLLLWASDYPSNAWYTFKQAKELGGMVKKGEKATKIVYWQMLKSTDSNGHEQIIPMLKSYYVFNYIQCEGLPEPKRKLGLELPPMPENDIVKACNVPLLHEGNRAFYSPSKDIIVMPHVSQFESVTRYNNTLMHELTHATAHETRCNRDTKNIKRFGDSAYAFEELVAELGSAFLSIELGLQHSSDLEHHTSYIASWIKVLKEDSKAIITASSQAQKACTWVIEQLQSKQQTLAA